MNTERSHRRHLRGLLRPMLGTVNMVSAPVVARERGIKVDEVRQTQRGAYETYIRLTVKTDKLERSVAGTVFSDGKPRIIQIKGIELESEFGSHMLYVTNQDKPGFIGALGTLLGNAGVNIATFTWAGRRRAPMPFALSRSTSPSPARPCRGLENSHTCVKPSRSPSDFSSPIWGIWGERHCSNRRHLGTTACLRACRLGADWKPGPGDAWACGGGSRVRRQEKPRSCGPAPSRACWRCWQSPPAALPDYPRSYRRLGPQRGFSPPPTWPGSPSRSP